MSVTPAAELVALARKGMAEGLNLGAERVRGVSVARTPIQYGDLRSSQTVVPATDADLESAVVSDLDYAVPVHENLTARHPTGQAKFLESASIESTNEVHEIVAASIRRTLGD
ncbi:hypothetical protein ACFS27_03375 [Promicromonospora vindobonensis]|uniref:HK97 gp10 family phage protein n=1 Tax=Promicromonospora vindobonensis TaxID=195748 RepID=A0ABW5VLH5_9MICO